MACKTQRYWSACNCWGFCGSWLVFILIFFIYNYLHCHTYDRILYIYYKSGESVEDALIREVKEETGLHITVSQVALLGVYSDSRRDLRRHTASAVFVVTLRRGSQLRAGDDAKDVEFVSIHDIPSLDMFSDHKSILGDFLHYISNNDSIDAEVIPDSGVPFTRSVCTQPL